MDSIRKLFLDYSVSTVINEKEEVNLKLEISQIVITLERVLFLGIFQCLNSLLYTILVLPLMFIKNPNYMNFARLAMLIFISCQDYYTIPMSRLYHDLKEQDFLKMNFVYNVVGVSDQLLMSFGQKCMKQMTSGVENFFISLIYVWIHTLHLSLAVTVFEVALNSSRYNLLLILLTYASVKIKITVFKKHDKKSLTNIIFNDIIERLQIMLYLFVILIKNFADGRKGIEEIAKGAGIILLYALLIDWIKHYFIIYYNTNLSLDTYRKIMSEFKENWKSVYTTGEFIEDNGRTIAILDPSCSLTLSYKFVALPQACMILRSLSSLIWQLSWFQKLMTYITCSFFKVIVNIFILILIN